MKKFLLFFMFFVPFLMFADIGQYGVSIAPDGSELKWEEGAWDFFIMHKSLVERKTGEHDTGTTNPQADTCIDENIGSTYTLTSEHIPVDANVDRAFLVWLAPIDPAKIGNGPTDNSVTLTFTHASNPNINHSMEVKASTEGYLNKNQNVLGNFEYEAIYVPEDMSRPQQPIGETGIYTYRVEISDFMKEIIKKGEAEGMNPGEALYGDYNVKGMECSNDESYLTTSGLMGGWFIPFVYTSAHIGAKKIYFYHGLTAYHIQTNVVPISGFTLPDEAIIKLGLVSFEGDPGLSNYLYSQNPEGMQISGQANPTDFAPLFNDCNPLKTQDSNGMPFSYTEMFNSISSIFSWKDATNYWCIGNPNNPLDPTNPIEYAIDADILMIDASPEGPFQGRFNKGDTQLNLKIGANQDQVYANLLIVSVDTKMPDFDIPKTAQTPNGREKDFCSCSTDEDAICKDRPFYYTIKIQNHGQNKASGVSLQDSLPMDVKYVPGTTEIATKFDAKGNGTDWTKVDDVNGDFPYTTAKQVAAVLDYCRGPENCGEGTTAWIRFVVEPKENLSKNAVIRNSAIISSYDEDGTKYDYYSNSNIPLRLKLGSCPEISACKLPPKAQCGGVRVEGNDSYCSSDKDCKDGKKCVDNECVLDENGKLTKNAKVSFGIGKNSPDKSSKVIIPNPGQKLVLGQFYLLSEDDADSDKAYKFTTARFQLTKDPNVEVKNFKLYKDENGDGKVDSGDKEIASSAAAATAQVEFAIESGHQLTKAGIKNHFLVIADALSNSTSGQAGSFHMTIEGPAAFSISDSGKVTVDGDKIDFVTYEFEPAEGFVFTKGTVTPPVPAFKDFNGEHPILQIRTKAIKIKTALKSIKVKNGGSAYTKFGEGIKSISLYLDKNGNGEVDADETLIQKISEFENANTMVVFDNIKDALKYSEDEEKILLFQVELDMEKTGDKVKIQIAQGGVKTTDSKDTIVGLPVASGDFVYECDATDPTSCAVGDDDDSGCTISAVSEDGNNQLYVAAMLLAALFGLLVFRFSRDGKKNR